VIFFEVGAPVIDNALGRSVQQFVRIISGARFVTRTKISDSILEWSKQKVVPAALTTFSSIISRTEIVGPIFQCTWPISGPWWTQELWMLSMCQKIRESAASQIFGHAGWLLDL